MRDQGKGFPSPHGVQGALWISISIVAIDRFYCQPKPTPAASTSASATPPVSAPPPPKPVEPAAVPPVPATTSETQDPGSSAPPSSTPAEQSTDAPPQAPALGTSFLSGDALQTTINNMVEMGYPKDQVMRALRASYNNPDRAVEYLLTVRINPDVGQRMHNLTRSAIGHSCSLRGRT